jgi:murein DD-endopeptidase MepM/ murein hydrolase activator NlpD
MEDFISRTHYVRTLLKNNRVMVMNLRKDRDSIQAYHDDLSHSREGIEKLAEDMRLRQEEIAMERAKRDYMLTRIMGEKQYYERSLDEMEKQSQEFTRYIRTEQLSVFVPGNFSGQLMWPFHGRITSGYGQRWGRSHTGIDIDCVTGDPLVAADSGVVILSGWKNGYGNTVIIQHPGNISTLYGHGSRNIATKGAKVRRGELVMLCGSTGRSTGDHLHFEVRVNGVPHNPMGYLR